jgi:DNA (cytosine-5)-methyltransferase 1
MIGKTLKASQAGYKGADHEDYIVAAPLSHGSNPNSNAAGRRREDDENLVFNWQSGGDVRHGLGDMPTALSKQQTPALLQDSAVRRLTPTECCRLQGFPDDWLGPPNEPPDSPRYSALGDAVTVNVAEWIGRRMLEAAA